MIAGGGIGGIIGSLVFRQQDAPQYRPGLIVVIALQVRSGPAALFLFPLGAPRVG